MSEVRPPAVSGMFYPGAPGTLARTVFELLEQAPTPAMTPKALIVPHAGYVYSGPVAATAYAQVRAHAHDIERVVLLGPSHRVAFRGIALSSARAFSTPLGEIPVDVEFQARAAGLPMVGVLDQAHAEEHSLEVHLPFLQIVLEDFSLVPVVVGDASAEEVGELLDALWGGPETLIVVSSDLSHYLDYESARRSDAETSLAIESKSQTLRPEQACGCRPINGLMYVAARRNLEVTTLDVRNSGDTAGDRRRVVGYGAYGLA